ncbi:hypothetical protein GJ496_007118 [Pomphorhynchus laevis]|nr:hypothetical protein GJ496_007118 [Pomphorhynchus laevis]
MHGDLSGLKYDQTHESVNELIQWPTLKNCKIHKHKSYGYDEKRSETYFKPVDCLCSEHNVDTESSMVCLLKSSSMIALSDYQCDNGSSKYKTLNKQKLDCIQLFVKQTIEQHKRLSFNVTDDNNKDDGYVISKLPLLQLNEVDSSHLPSLKTGEKLKNDNDNFIQVTLRDRTSLINVPRNIKTVSHLKDTLRSHLNDCGTKLENNFILEIMDINCNKFKTLENINEFNANCVYRITERNLKSSSIYEQIDVNLLNYQPLVDEGLICRPNTEFQLKSNDFTILSQNSRKRQFDLTTDGRNSIGSNDYKILAYANVDVAARKKSPHIDHSRHSKLNSMKSKAKEFQQLQRPTTEPSIKFYLNLQQTLLNLKDEYQLLCSIHTKFCSIIFTDIDNIQKMSVRNYERYNNNMKIRFLQIASRSIFQSLSDLRDVVMLSVSDVQKRGCIVQPIEIEILLDVLTSLTKSINRFKKSWISVHQKCYDLCSQSELNFLCNVPAYLNIFIKECQEISKGIGQLKRCRINKLTNSSLACHIHDPGFALNRYHFQQNINFQIQRVKANSRKRLISAQHFERVRNARSFYATRYICNNNETELSLTSINWYLNFNKMLTENGNKCTDYLSYNEPTTIKSYISNNVMDERMKCVELTSKIMPQRGYCTSITHI